MKHQSDGEVEIKRKKDALAEIERMEDALEDRAFFSFLAVAFFVILLCTMFVSALMSPPKAHNSLQTKVASIQNPFDAAAQWLEDGFQWFMSYIEIHPKSKQQPDTSGNYQNTHKVT